MKTENPVSLPHHERGRRVGEDEDFSTETFNLRVTVNCASLAWGTIFNVE